MNDMHASFLRKNTPASPEHYDTRNVFVLIACEESQTECLAFRNAGCIAFSCDLQECSGSHPEWHFIGDALLHLFPGVYMTQAGTFVTIPRWDLVIAHPPCTYLSRAAGAYLYRGKTLQLERYCKGVLALNLFKQFLDAPAQFVCVENPVPFKCFNLPAPSFAVHPKDFGAPWLKRTLYWTTRNLPPLMFGCEASKYKSYVYSTRGGKKRSKSFPEIAEAMATQWVPIIQQSLNLR